MNNFLPYNESLRVQCWFVLHTEACFSGAGGHQGAFLHTEAGFSEGS